MRVIDLGGQTALITGASSGIGRATALALAEAGCDVAIHHNTSAGGADEAAGAIRGRGRRAVTLQGDLTASAHVDRVVRAAAQALGGIDILVNHAGSLVRRVPLAEASDGHWGHVLASTTHRSLRRPGRAQRGKPRGTAPDGVEVEEV